MRRWIRCRRRRRLVGLGTFVAGLAVLAGTAGCGLLGGADQKTLVAHFDRTVGLYKNSDVRILGIRVGHVTKIVPEGRSVRVEITYDAKYKVPVDAKALVVSPSIVSDRYVQLAPVWRSGPTLADKADFGMDRTAVPVELDQIYSALDQLNRSLGPGGANNKGALSGLVKTGATNLKGNGAALNSTLKDLSEAVSTLSNQRSDLFGTVSNLQDFTTTIANSDATVRQFDSDLAAVAAQLAGQRQALAAAVANLSTALGSVAVFVKENKSDLTANVKDLASVTQVLVKQKKSLEEFLDNSAVALSNLQLAYNPRSGTLDTRDNNNNNGTNTVCQLLGVSGQGALCAQVTGLLGQLQTGGLPGPGSIRPQVQPPDLTLGGLLGVAP